MDKYLDKDGVQTLWDWFKNYVDKKFSKAGQPPAGADGKSAYQYAVDGGYTGTEDEFQALLADAANKQYVDNLFNQVAPVIVKVQTVRDKGNATEIVNTYNVKCYPVEVGALSYAIKFFIRNAGESNLPHLDEIKIIPPEQYAFTWLYGSSGVFLEIYGWISTSSEVPYGQLSTDGGISFNFKDVQFYGSALITGAFTLEVA